MSLTVCSFEDNRHLNQFRPLSENKIKITGFESKTRGRETQASRTVLELERLHIYYCCWIHQGDKPIEKYMSPDLQLQLGPGGDTGELFNLESCLLIRQYSCCRDEGSGKSTYKFIVVRSRSRSFCHTNIKSLLTSLKA